MINIIRKLWRVFDRVLYKTASALAGVFGKSVPDDKWAALMQFVKFGLVGVMNTFIDYFSYLIALGIFTRLGWFGDKAYIPSNFVGLCVSVSNAFYWNNKYVFKEKEGQHRSLIRAYLKTFSSYAITGLGLKTVLLYVLISVAGISDVVAPIIIMFIVVPINFIMNKLWAFG